VNVQYLLVQKKFLKFFIPKKILNHTKKHIFSLRNPWSNFSTYYHHMSAKLFSRFSPLIIPVGSFAATALIVHYFANGMAQGNVTCWYNDQDKKVYMGLVDFQKAKILSKDQGEPASEWMRSMTSSQVAREMGSSLFSVYHDGKVYKFE
jgi:hypothetical protein